MTLKKNKEFKYLDTDSIGKDINSTAKPANLPARMGRPKQNPHAEDKKLTIRVPADLHRKLRYASVDLDKPMVEIAVDALIAYLAKHERKAV
jgi:hypothetical protein